MTAEKQRLIEDRDKVKTGGNGVPTWPSANGELCARIIAPMAMPGIIFHTTWRAAKHIAGAKKVLPEFPMKINCYALRFLCGIKRSHSERTILRINKPRRQPRGRCERDLLLPRLHPTHSYMRMLYKYPQNEYPYAHLVEESKRRGKHDREFELTDTNIFANNRYFDVAIEYAKADVSDMLMRITVTNRGPEAAAIELLPTLWFRNTWAWGYDATRPEIYLDDKGIMKASHKQLGSYYFYCEGKHEALFCENDTNTWRLHQHFQPGTFKDGINDYIIFNYPAAINKVNKGTKAAYRIDLNLKAGESKSIRLRLVSRFHQNHFNSSIRF